jgi:hypothetical protein
MGKGSYYLLLIMLVVDLLLIVRYALRFSAMGFLKEFVVLIVLLVFSVVSLALISSRKDNGWTLAAVVFALVMLNMAYSLYCGYQGILPIAIALWSAICFVFCVAMVGAFKGEPMHIPSAEQRVEKELEREAAALENAEKEFDEAVKKKRK